MKVASIIAIVLVVILAVGAACVGVGIVTLSIFRSSNNSVNFVDRIPSVQLGDVSASATETQDFQVSGPAMLDLSNQFGDVEITGGEGNQIQVTVTKTAWGNDDDQAERALSDIQVLMTQEEDRVTIRVEQPDSDRLIQNNQRYRVDFVVSVPTLTTAVVTNRSGDVTFSGTQGKADLSTDFGNLRVADFLGGLAARTRSGKVEARQIDLLPSGEGDVSLHSDFGAIVLEDCNTERVDVTSKSGALTLNNVISSGAVSLTSDFGKISYTSGSASDLDIIAKSGEIELENLDISGAITAQSKFGSVDLSAALGSSYDLSTDSGSVLVDQASGPIKARSGFGKIQITGGNEVDLDLETNSGEIVYRGSLGVGPHRLVTSFGGIQLTLPAESAFDFDLETGFGKIESDFEVEIQGEPDENHWVGSVGVGGGSLTAVTKSGKIEVLRGE